MAAMRVGLLTGGGDSPGLNAVIRAIVRQGSNHHHDELFGFLNAWEGVMAQRYVDLTVESTRGLLPKGGTILGTRRGSPFDQPDGLEKVKQAFTDLVLDGLIAIGGNGTLTVSQMLYEQIGIPIVGVPKTIDNDIVGTDVTFGFHTAVQIATDAIDRLHTTAESPRPGDPGRGHGPPRRMDRDLRRASPVGPRSSSCPRSRSTSMPSARRSGAATRAVATRRSSSWPRVPCRWRGRWSSPSARPTSTAT